LLANNVGTLGGAENAGCFVGLSKFGFAKESDVMFVVLENAGISRNRQVRPASASPLYTEFK
jgi:hypothetical protein